MEFKELCMSCFEHVTMTDALPFSLLLRAHHNSPSRRQCNYLSETLIALSSDSWCNETLRRCDSTVVFQSELRGFMDPILRVLSVNRAQSNQQPTLSPS